MRNPCTHYADDGTCSIGACKGVVPLFICMDKCGTYDGPERTDAMRIAVKPIRGAGDVLSKAIVGATGGKVQPCWLCKKVSEGLNAAIPIGGGDGS